MTFKLKSSLITTAINAIAVGVGVGVVAVELGFHSL